MKKSLFTLCLILLSLFVSSTCFAQIVAGKYLRDTDNSCYVQVNSNKTYTLKDWTSAVIGGRMINFTFQISGSYSYDKNTDSYIFHPKSVKFVGNRPSSEIASALKQDVYINYKLDRSYRRNIELYRHTFVLQGPKAIDTEAKKRAEEGLNQ